MDLPTHNPPTWAAAQLSPAKERGRHNSQHEALTLKQAHYQLYSSQVFCCLQFQIHRSHRQWSPRRQKAHLGSLKIKITVLKHTCQDIKCACVCMHTHTNTQSVHTKRQGGVRAAAKKQIPGDSLRN